MQGLRAGLWGVQRAQWNRGLPKVWASKKILGLLELGHLAFGVRWVFFWEGGLGFLMYTVVVFTFGCTTYKRQLVFIF